MFKGASILSLIEPFKFMYEISKELLKLMWLKNRLNRKTKKKKQPQMDKLEVKHTVKISNKQN